MVLTPLLRIPSSLPPEEKGLAAVLKPLMMTSDAFPFRRAAMHSLGASRLRGCFKRSEDYWLEWLYPSCAEDGGPRLWVLEGDTPAYALFRMGKGPVFDRVSSTSRRLPRKHWRWPRPQLPGASTGAVLPLAACSARCRSCSALDCRRRSRTASFAQVLAAVAVSLPTHALSAPGTLAAVHRVPRRRYRCSSATSSSQRTGCRLTRNGLHF